MEFVKLFEPITINKLEIKNRIVMPSMGLLYTSDYTLNDRLKAFYRERAKGGVGLLTIGPVSVDKVGSVPLMLGLHEDQFIEPFAELLEELHQDSEAKIGIQLLHMGRYAFSFLTGMQAIAPSPIASKLTGETPREMTLEDIEQVQEAYKMAAKRAEEAGFDFIEILACTGYLISQFLSPVTNKRTDQYGGSLENRMRFGLEVFSKVRQALSSDTTVGIRVAGNEFMQGGNTNKEAAIFAVEAEKLGINAINVTGGWHETNIPQLTPNVPPAGFLYLAKGIKEKVRVPVFASNRLGDPVIAEKALRSGTCDMICWGRPLIADPQLPDKVKQGRLDEIIPCISCNQGCFDSVFSGAAVTCIMNPRAGHEDSLNTQQASVPKKIFVAGGGPAGMQFAITAAERGHDVTLYEKESVLGGQVNLAKTPPGKEEFERIIHSMEQRMKNRGVRVQLQTELTPKHAEQERPDVVVVATGAVPTTIDVPGCDKSHVVEAWDVLSQKVYDIGRNVVVVGGNATGCETALFIAHMDIIDPKTYTFIMFHGAEDPEFATSLLHKPGRRITVIDMIPRLAENVGNTARWSLLKSLRLLGVQLRTKTKLVQIEDDSVLLETEQGTEKIPADTVVMAVGAQSVNSLAKRLEDSGIPVITIGDAKSPRKITEAIKEGFQEALNI